jgi:hypothetical protein
MIASEIGRPKNMPVRLPVASPMIQAWTKPCSAMGPRISPSTIGDAAKPKRDRTQPTVPSTIMMMTSEIELRMAKVPMMVMKPTDGHQDCLRDCHDRLVGITADQQPRRQHQDGGDEQTKNEGVDDRSAALEQGRSGPDALHQQRAQDDRIRRRAWNAEHQRGDEAAADGGVVGCFRRHDAIGFALAELLVRPGSALGFGIGNEACDGTARSGKNADQRSDDRGPQQVEPRAPRR